MDENNDFEQANSEINAIKVKLQHMDEKQTREINDIESFFSVKGLKEENIITKAKLSIIFIGNELFICKRFVNNLDCKYGEKAEIICREFVDYSLIYYKRGLVIIRIILLNENNVSKKSFFLFLLTSYLFSTYLFLQTKRGRLSY
jgi:hypothetical protein